MKEYICKEELLNKLESKDYEPINQNNEDFEIGKITQYHIDLSTIKYNTPTVTKADICRELTDIMTKKANEMWNTDDAINFHTDLMNVLDMVLAEMEKDE